jgi:hypothetical protein
MFSHRMFMIAALVAAASAVAASGPSSAQPDQPSQNACFARSLVESFSAPNDRTVYLRVGVSDIYRLDLMKNCLNLSYRDSLGLEDQPADAFICSPLEATVVYRVNGIRERCPVTAIHKLTKAEIAATPKRDLP